MGTACIGSYRASQRQTKDKQAALARLTAHQNIAAVLAENLSADSQPQSGAACSFCADKRTKNIVDFLRWNSTAVVAHLEAQPFALFLFHRCHMHARRSRAFD